MKRDRLEEKMRAVVERRIRPFLTTPDIPLHILLEEAYLTGLHDAMDTYRRDEEKEK